MPPLTGRVAVVTASTKGIGFAIAKRLCRDGASVVISSRKKANVDRAVQELEQIAFGRIAGLTCHVGKAEDRSKLVDHALGKFGRLDILVSNAGVNPHYGKLLDVEESVWDKVFDVNVKAGFMLSKLAVPHMRKTGNGVILFISSLVGYIPFLGLTTYAVSKTALLGLTKALALELAEENIRVNCIAPGFIKTDFSKALWSDGGDNSVGHHLSKNIPLGRLGEPDDVSGAAAFLCSDDAKYITGETTLISGGINCRL